MQEVALPPQETGTYCLSRLEGFTGVGEGADAAAQEPPPHTSHEGPRMKLRLRDLQRRSAEENKAVSLLKNGSTNCTAMLAACHTLLRGEGRPRKRPMSTNSPANAIVEQDASQACPGGSFAADSSAYAAPSFSEVPSSSSKGRRLFRGSSTRLWSNLPGVNSRVNTPEGSAELVHPLVALQILGSVDFNEAFLDSLLPHLVLHRSLRAGGGPQEAFGGPRCRDLPPREPENLPSESLPVRVEHVEDAIFHVRVDPSQPSPIQPLLEAWKGSLAGDIDGLEFFLTPLVDEGLPAIRALQTPSTSSRTSMARSRDGERNLNRLAEDGGLSQSFSASNSLPPLDGPIIFRGTPATWILNFRGKREAEREFREAGGLTRTASFSFAGFEGSNVACLRKYCTATALYFALIRAGVCAGEGFPFLAVQRMTWGDLLAGGEVQAQLRRLAEDRQDGLARAMLGKLRESPGEQIPVAVTLPAPLKGRVRALPVVARRAGGSFRGARPPLFYLSSSFSPSFTLSSHEPFTDAEVFQLFYLQLVLRALFDVRLPSPAGLRPDRLWARAQAARGLAFADPDDAAAWILFPPRSRTLGVVDLARATLPAYAGELKETKKGGNNENKNDDEEEEEEGMPLFGACAGTRCLTRLGYAAVGWAAGLRITSPRAAAAALRGLFAHFRAAYGGPRGGGDPRPRVFDCSARALARMRAANAPLAGFFVGVAPPPPAGRGLRARCRRYARTAEISLFDGSTAAIRLRGRLGRGGSSVVFRGVYGQREAAVAVKVFVVPAGRSHADYVRDSLADVFFGALMNLCEEHHVMKTCRMHDFVVSATPPDGLAADDLRELHGGAEVPPVKLCYLVMNLMDGTLGRFLNENDPGYDPLYDTLENSPLRPGELFQLLYAQLAMKYLFDWKVLDMMLNGQLRGDNIGFRYLSSPGERTSLASSGGKKTRRSYRGILVVYQETPQAAIRYLRFPAEDSDGASRPLRFIFFLDLAQGTQPEVNRLVEKGRIGECVLSSCVEEDGFGRYWPPHELYCRYLDVSGVADEVVAWGSRLRIHSKNDAREALHQLFELYYPQYRVENPAEEIWQTHAVYEWKAEVVSKLSASNVFLPGDSGFPDDACAMEGLSC